MKKILLCTCCAVLFGSAVHALNFENRSDNPNMKIRIEFDSPIFIKVKDGTTIQNNTPAKITQIIWQKDRGETVCPVDGLKMTDTKTVVYSLTAEPVHGRMVRGVCTIE